MNILKKELRHGLKHFLLWSILIILFVLGGMVKFSGIAETDTNIFTEMMEAIPKPVLAMFGMAEANIETFGGFYAVIQFYIMIAISFYAVHLGTGSVIRENVDKTYEFLFTKPCGRMHILSVKMIAGVILITAMTLLNLICSFLAPNIYDINNSIKSEMLLLKI